MTEKPNSTQESLLEAFSRPQQGEWRTLAEEQLGGAPFEKKLITTTPEGIAIQPIYDRKSREQATSPGWPGTGDFTRGTRPGGQRQEPWLIAQEFPYGTAAQFNEAALADLMRGQNALNVLLDVATQNGKDADTASIGEVGACGVSLSTKGDFEEAFRGIHLDAIPVHFQTGACALPILALWVASAKVGPEKLRGCLQGDPLGHLVRSGTLPTTLERAYDELADLLSWSEKHAPGIDVLGPSGQPHVDAGGHAVQELAFALATSLDYLREMEKRGIALDVAANKTWLRFSVGPQVFIEIAKFRAARRCWSRMLAACGASEEAQRAKMHARTGLYHRTKTDPYVNMLRGATESFAAVVGGVDSLNAGAFDEIVREPDHFARRISRNTQIILQEECNLLEIGDPGGGSYFLETLTDDIANRAWALFQEVEKRGGMFAALQEGFPQEEVTKVAAGRKKLLNQRRDVLVGTNQYANATEKPLERRRVNYVQLHQERSRELAAFRVSGEVEQDDVVLGSLQNMLNSRGEQRIRAAIEAAKAGASLGEITRSLRPSEGLPPKVTPVRVHRLAEKYEAMREASDNYALDKGHPPKLYLINVGPLRQHKLRADFTRTFFEPAGFDVLYPKGESDPDTAAQAAVDSGARVAVICSTDDAYPEAVPAIAQALKAKDPNIRLYLAGFPGEHEAAYREAGLDDYIFIKSNNYETLATALRHVGVLEPVA